MFPTLGHLLSYLTGNHITLGFPTFGLLVALSFIAAAGVLMLELKRKERVGLFKSWKEKFTVGEKPTIIETLGNAVFGFLLGYKIVYAFQNGSAFTENPANIIISTDGNLLGGIVAAIVYAGFNYYQKNKVSLAQPLVKEEEVHPYQLVSTITIVAAISGIIGAKIFHNLENWNEFVADPIGSLTSFSGLTFFGGLIFGAAAVVWYVRKKGMNPLSVADSVAPGLILAYALGRLGCQLSGDGDWGINNPSPKPGWLSWLPDWMWSFTYPHNVSGEGVHIPGCVGEYCNVLPVPVYPTPIYETIMGLLIFAFLWSIRKKIDKPGMMISAYLLLAGIERFFIEQIRVNTEYNILGGITQAEIIATILIILGAAGLVYFWKRKTDIRF
jgi:phosphatidylglycerol:prolipoprotein diacylglycerol transferase